MNLKDIIEVIQAHLSQYFRDFFEIVINPYLSGFNLRKSIDFHPSLWVFLILSVFIGTSLASLTPLRSKEPLQIAVIIVLVHWFLLAAFTHVICKIIARNKANFFVTANCSLRICAVTYVFSCVISLLVTTAGKTSSVEDIFVISAFWITQSLLMPILIGPVIAGAYSLSIVKSIVLISLVFGGIVLIVGGLAVSGIFLNSITIGI